MGKVEAKVQKRIMEAVAKRGYTVKVIAASKDGVPDTLNCLSGLFVGIEVKAPGKLNNTSPLQDYNLKLINESGGIGLVLDDASNLHEVLEAIEKVKPLISDIRDKLFREIQCILNQGNTK